MGGSILSINIDMKSVIVGLFVAIFIALGWSFFNRNKDISKNLVTKKDFFYWMLFLMFVCISILSDKFYQIQNFMDYISFSGTILSIILGVIAIIYSFFQSHDSNKSVEDMHYMINELKETIRKLNGIENMITLTSETQSNTKDLYEKLDEMVTQKMPEVVKATMEDSFKTHYTQFGEKVEVDIDNWEIPF